VTTHERELTKAVDLCSPDGLALNPDARGWSRRPLHRANLGGHVGRNKRWDYWAVLGGDIVISATIADLDLLQLADVWWADLVTCESGGHGIIAGPGEAASLPEHPSTTPLEVHRDGLDLSIVDDEDGTRLRASWHEPDGRDGAFDVVVALPAGHESLNVVIPWDDELFNFTSKHQARPAVGTLRIGERTWTLGERGADAWGVLDVGRGRWPATITWNWGGGAGRADGHVVGLQVGARWTAGTGFTENGLIVDGRLSKLGAELEWTYDWDQPLKPWRVVDPLGQLDATLTPRYDKHTLVEVSADLGTEVHQVFGTWAGRLTTDDGLEVRFHDLQGFAEEARQRW
jgi:hypothetical protein